MTKRELCERRCKILSRLNAARVILRIEIPREYIRLLLDLAVPEEKPEEPKRGEGE
jgi:hypothetical protein